MKYSKDNNGLYRKEESTGAFSISEVDTLLRELQDEQLQNDKVVEKALNHSKEDTIRTRAQHSVTFKALSEQQESTTYYKVDASASRYPKQTDTYKATTFKANSAPSIPAPSHIPPPPEPIENAPQNVPPNNNLQDSHVFKAQTFAGSQNTQSSVQPQPSEQEFPTSNLPGAFYEQPKQKYYADVYEENTEKFHLEDSMMFKAQRLMEMDLTQEGDDEDRETWLKFKPAVAVVSIFLVAIIGLSVLHVFANPLIEGQQERLINAPYLDILPGSVSFEDVAPTLPEGVIGIKKADADKGYVITTQAQGFVGQVPVMVAFDSNGDILNVSFTQNSETAGLGAKLMENKDFSEQFKGHTTDILVDDDEVDMIAGATVSSKAGVKAINLAIEQYSLLVNGTEPVSPNQAKDAEQLDNVINESGQKEIRKQLLPYSIAISQVDLGKEQTIAAFKGDDNNYIIYTQSDSAPELVTVAVALNSNGLILDLWIQIGEESTDYTKTITENEDFKKAFVGKTNTNDVDVIAGATLSSNAIIECVNRALTALPTVEESKLK